MRTLCLPGEVLIYEKDNHEEVKEHDVNAVGIYKESPEEGNLELAGHVRIELSRVLACFLAASKTNVLTVKVCGKRKREVGLVVPGCYWAMTNRKKGADILSTEINNIKERYPYFELEIVQDAIRKPLVTKQARN